MLQSSTPQDDPRRSKTGVLGLDVVLGGGLPSGELYLVQGSPGTGKTLLALSFLRAGLEAGEKCLLLTLSQRADSIREMVEAHGWPIDGLEIFELEAGKSLARLSEHQSLFRTGEIELEELSAELLSIVTQHEPDRVAFDAVSHLRLLAGSPLLYRRQLLALRDHFASRDMTVMMTDNHDLAPGDGELQAIVHGTILLDHAVSRFGESRRSVEVRKCRNVATMSGRHDLIIETGGISVFPRISGGEPFAPEMQRRSLATSVDELDALLDGGPVSGTSTLLVGPAGSGKSTVAALYACATAERGERAAVFLFDESPWTFRTRSEGLGIPIGPHMDSGVIEMWDIRPSDLSIGHLLSLVRSGVRERDVKTVIIDSLSGYLSARSDQDHLLSRIQDLLAFLSNHEVFTFILLAQHRQGALGLVEPAHVSFLADAVVLFRTFEHAGTVRHGIAVYKKRYGRHERTIRELLLADGSVHIGEPLSEFSGLLSGTAEFRGKRGELL